ncbi:hypothetical protein F2P81_004242 [Scophthalmus maximus]|uniref:Uncharacterized protein n=1 Tax=Scophthalmus maximus TaxID=52904 RepID=A0A6A4TCC4_SCOMX|nr:hypothetical protein F2P81_004242 [Scophthalmus maximus]
MRMRTLLRCRVLIFICGATRKETWTTKKFIGKMIIDDENNHSEHQVPGAVLPVYNQKRDNWVPCLQEISRLQKADNDI